MARKSKAAKTAGAIGSVRENPYVQRIVGDEDLRDSLREAYESASHAYGRITNGKPATKALMDDKKLHKDLRKAAESLRDASMALREGPKRKRSGGGLRRTLMLAIVGGAIAMVASESLRQKLLDTLFGKEEEFEYAPTAPATPAPAPTAAPAG